MFIKSESIVIVVVNKVKNNLENHTAILAWSLFDLKNLKFINIREFDGNFNTFSKKMSGIFHHFTRYLKTYRFDR